MKRFAYLLVLLPLLAIAQTTETPDKEAIKTLLLNQQEAWNNYDIETFMEGYWKSDSLTFYGSGGVVKGWEATLARYKKSYPSKEHFGTLTFKFHEITAVDKTLYYVLGEYFLTRPVGDTNGLFMLLVKNINGQWKVIADTSAKVK